MTDPTTLPQPGDRLRLIALSFVMLFVELALIRWTGSNIVYLAYFSNFVLLGSFLGIGVGFLRARARHDLFRWAPAGLAAFVGFVVAIPVQVDRTGSDLIYFGTFRTTGLPTWVMLPIVFVVVAAIMAMLAQGVARTFVRFEPLEAYRLDILGSLLGIAAFSGLAFLGAPPVWWGAITAVALLALLRPAVSLIHVAASLTLVGILLGESLGAGLSWSPYYEITTTPAEGGRWTIEVNGTPHQAIESVAQREAKRPVYFAPYRNAPGIALDDVLIIGAGNGADVAIALRQGAEHVDAVEIDPQIQALGAELHPDHPYQDPRVQVHINDGRAFLEHTERRYDLILFALPDSLTLIAGQSSLRLESYLFTTEAMQAARAHLRPGGVFGMYNYYREEWLVARLARTLSEVYGHPPCVDTTTHVGRLALLMTGPDPTVISCASEPLDVSAAPAPATDDHPFLYLRRDVIPSFYLLTIGLILAASLLVVRGAGGPLRAMTPYADLFFLGIGFLLLETKSVAQFALLFGTTWFVNALVFAGVLASVLLAIEIAKRVRIRRPSLLYGALLIALAIAYAIPVGSLLALPFLPRFAAAVGLAFAPILLANLVFAERFRSVGDATTAFGANLLGAMVGGVLEYVALITGYRALLVVVAAAYALAFISGRSRQSSSSLP